MSLEAAAGKNPVNHVGKIYNVVAQHIAQSLVTASPEILPERGAAGIARKDRLSPMNLKDYQFIKWNVLRTMPQEPEMTNPVTGAVNERPSTSPMILAHSFNS